MARRPQPRALLGRRGPFERHGIVLAGDLLHGVDLLLHARRRAVELHQQHRTLAQRQLGLLVDRALGIRVEKPAEIGAAIEQALQANRPAVIDVVTDIDALAPLAVS